MKNKAGFTLVELLAVIVILAIVITIAVPSTLAISNRIKNNLYCSKIDFIKNAAEIYGEDRKDSFGNITVNGTSYKGQKIKVLDLVKGNYLKKDKESAPYIEDPRDKSKSLDDYAIDVYLKNNRIYVAMNQDLTAICEK